MKIKCLIFFLVYIYNSRIILYSVGTQKIKINWLAYSCSAVHSILECDTVSVRSLLNIYWVHTLRKCKSNTSLQQRCGSGSERSASFCRIHIRIRIHNIFHVSGSWYGSRSRSEPTVVHYYQPSPPSFCTVNLSPLVPHHNSLIHHSSPFTPFSFTAPPSPLLL